MHLRQFKTAILFATEKKYSVRISLIYALILTFSLSLAAQATTKSALPEEQSTSQQLPSLQGEKAINYLKESNQFASFSEVFAATNFTRQAKLSAADGIADDVFGGSVSIGGDTAAVGAPKFGNGNSKGVVYVFIRNGPTWTQQARLEASNGITHDSFGVSVAIEGDTLIVGANSAFVGENSAQGAAYVFTRSSSTWTQQQKLVATDGVPDSAILLPNSFWLKYVQ